MDNFENATFETLLIPNCGCPQRWAIGEGIGAHLMSQPELVRDMVRQTKARATDIPCSIKIRIHKDVRETVEFVKRAEFAGVDFITVHGRRKWQKSSVPVDVEAIRLVRENASVPIIANGGVFSLKEASGFARDTGVVGVMVCCAKYAGHCSPI
ncbi:MAG: tRNA-dihydrouridine synthase [Olpidium bornovanus]|uniref:tRNA-dihydrouridine synthase n=1 Tax=Olpidium bornovanus TaxID=278681 RepID=A0A8H8DMW0_9FUNG|nr:MAG: tRNA-dihydrouridine synthase [Olpidium bornovanus]